MLVGVLTLFAMYKESPAQRPQPAATRSAAAVPDISYTVSMPKPWTHLLEVRMRIRWSAMPAQLELKMPVWTPGSYLVREYARHVQDFEAKSGPTDLAWQKTSKNTWQVETKGAREIVASYRVYSNELTVRTNELNDEHAFWNNTALLMFPKGQLSAPSTVTVEPYSTWKVATGLPAVPGAANTFRAENFDVLYDSPFEVGNFKEISFTVQGKPHRFVVDGEGNYDLDRIVADTTKIIEESYKIFGELPYENYLFILNLRGGGGLEHLNSTALQFDRFGFKPDSRYHGFLGLVAHEFFHLWNVKRIRPDALGPFDYENENYTKLLWVAEGGTEYYSNLLLRRAGLISAEEYLDGRASGIKQLQERPGRLAQSLEESSFDAWIKYYRQDENSINNQISYYDKGEIVNFLLDIVIRTSSNGARSLDDVMRALYNDFYKRGRNYTPQDFQRAAETAAGRSLDDFFARYVRGTAELNYNAVLEPIGLRLVAADAYRGRAYLGADLAEDAGGRLTVRALAAGTPAYEQGLNTGDQIVAVEGYRASTSRLQSFINDRKPGDRVRLTIFRFDKLREIEITLGADPRKNYSFAPVANPTDIQKRLYREYLNDELGS